MPDAKIWCKKSVLFYGKYIWAQEVSLTFLKFQPADPFNSRQKSGLDKRERWMNCAELHQPLCQQQSVTGTTSSDMLIKGVFVVQLRRLIWPKQVNCKSATVMSVLWSVCRGSVVDKLDLGRCREFWLVPCSLFAPADSVSVLWESIKAIDKKTYIH